uniref:Uncharacterized protein n=1 Tax=Micromonospora chalcea TaxID=1874 RepID=B5L6I7_MICCH|nr:unknown [Micromonospora chalcea]
MSTSRPVAPTTAAIAPNAPTGATHMIIARTLKTSRCSSPTARRTGSPRPPRPCTAKPTRRATSSVWSTSPSVSAETSVVGMIPSRNSVVPPLSPAAAAWPAPAVCAPRSRPAPGWIRLPTTSPMASATVDISRN